jgi:hypothetical protein
VISTLGEIVEEAVELIGHVGVVERGGVGVVPQGGGGVRVAQAGLGLEQPSVVYQVGGHAMTEAMQGRVLDACGLPRLVSRRERAPAVRWADRRGDGLNSQSRSGSVRAAQARTWQRIISTVPAL